MELSCNIMTPSVILDIQKWSEHVVFLTHFHFKMCFVPQRRALLRHLNFQRWRLGLVASRTKPSTSPLDTRPFKFLGPPQNYHKIEEYSLKLETTRFGVAS